MSKICTQQDLKTLVCQEPGCDCEGGVMYLHSACHPNAPTWTKYHKDGFVIVECAECRKEILKIAVQEQPEGLEGAEHARMLKFIKDVANTKHYPRMDFERVANDARALLATLEK